MVQRGRLRRTVTLTFPKSRGMATGLNPELLAPLRCPSHSHEVARSVNAASPGRGAGRTGSRRLWAAPGPDPCCRALSSTDLSGAGCLGAGCLGEKALERSRCVTVGSPHPLTCVLEKSALENSQRRRQAPARPPFGQGRQEAPKRWGSAEGWRRRWAPCRWETANGFRCRPSTREGSVPAQLLWTTPSWCAGAGRDFTRRCLVGPCG